jgi:hypothetical protein
LEALVGDLESVDAVEQEVRPLRDLVAELARVAASTGAGPVELERVRQRVLAVLRAFATVHASVAPGGPAANVARRDPDFWKR